MKQGRLITAAVLQWQWPGHDISSAELPGVNLHTTFNKTKKMYINNFIKNIEELLKIYFMNNLFLSGKFSFVFSLPLFVCSLVG